MSCHDFFASVEPRSVIDLDGMLRRNEIDIYTHALLVHALDCRRESALARDAHKRNFHQRQGSWKHNPYTKALRDAANGVMAMMEQLGLRGLGPDVVDRLHPAPAVALEFVFTLEKPYLSRDDAPFYPIDNPVRKERIFRVPMVAPSTWKGSLRSAAVDNLLLRPPDTGGDLVEERIRLIKLFGDEKGASEEDLDLPEDAPSAAHDSAPAAPTPAPGDDGQPQSRPLRPVLDDHFRQLGILRKFRQREKACFLKDDSDEYRRKGRLHFLPSYFDGIELDVLNPRDRVTRAGTLPIVMEIVPAGCSATFSLLYFPFDLLGQTRETTLAELRQDWRLIGEALVRVFRWSGFGAKKSSGNGKAKDTVKDLRFECGVSGFSPPPLTRIEEFHQLWNAFPEEAANHA